MGVSFEEHDQFDLNEFKSDFERFAKVEHDFVDGSLVVTLSATFGYGKSTFFEMWKTDLENRRKTDESTPKCIIVNAWESDFLGDPFISILSQLTKIDLDDSGSGKMKERLGDALLYISLISGQVLKSVGNFDAIEVVEKYNKYKNSSLNKIDALKLYEDKAQALTQISDILEEHFGDKSHIKVYVMVDELDRCRPDYAVHFLETIKHLFNIHGIVFVLGVDVEHLKNTTRKLFGYDLVFEEYFRKFSHREVQLPTRGYESQRRLNKYYYEKYVVKSRHGYVFSKQGDERYFSLILSLFDTSPRSTEHVFRLYAHTTSDDSAHGNRFQAYYSLLVFFMCALFVLNKELFVKLTRSSESDEEVIKLFTSNSYRSLASENREVDSNILPVLIIIASRYYNTDADINAGFNYFKSIYLVSNELHIKRLMGSYNYDLSQLNGRIIENMGKAILRASTLVSSGIME